MQTDQPPSAGFDYSRILLLRTNNNVKLINNAQKSVVIFQVPGVVVSADDIKLVKIRLRSAIFPNVFYNITNAVLSFSYYTGTVWQTTDISIRNGVYDIYTLLDAITTAILNVEPYGNGVVLSSFLTVGYDSIINRVVFVVSELNAPTAFGVRWTDFLYQLGFREEADFEILEHTTRTATFGPNLEGVNTVLLVSPDIPTENYCSIVDGPIFGSVPIQGDFLSEVHHSFDSGSGFVVPVTASLDTFTFYLYDQNGNILDFQDYDWTLVLEIIVTKDNAPVYEDFHMGLKRILQTMIAQNQEAGYEEKQKGPTKEELELFERLQMPQGMKIFREALARVTENPHDHKNSEE